MTKISFDQGEPNQSFVKSFAHVLAFVAGVGLLGHYQPFGTFLDRLVNGRPREEKKEAVPENSIVQCLDDVLECIDKNAYVVDFSDPRNNPFALTVTIFEPLKSGFDEVTDDRIQIYLGNYDRQLFLYQDKINNQHRLEFVINKDLHYNKLGIARNNGAAVAREYILVSDNMNFRLNNVKTWITGADFNDEELERANEKINSPDFDGFDNIPVGSELKVKEKYDEIYQHFLRKKNKN